MLVQNLPRPDFTGGNKRPVQSSQRFFCDIPFLATPKSQHCGKLGVTGILDDRLNHLLNTMNQFPEIARLAKTVILRAIDPDLRNVVGRDGHLDQ